MGILIYKVVISTLLTIVDISFGGFLYNDKTADKSIRQGIIMFGVLNVLAFVGMWI